MCVRTKTSYGCGHVYKTTNECHSSRCEGIQKFHYMREGDCRSCKLGGDSITRGREGKGRYAQEMTKRLKDREALREVSSNVLPKLDISGGASPWAPLSRREKEWQSPTRKMADDAWLEEHEKRMADLQCRLKGFNTSSAPHTPSAPVPAVPRSPSLHDVADWGMDERDHDDGDDDQYYHDDDENDDEQPRQRPRRESIHVEIRSVHNDHHDHDRHHARPVYQRQRHYSHDSFESSHSALSSARSHKHAPTTYTTHHDHYHDQHDSGYYGSYGSRGSHGYGAKTEPFAYSHSRVYEVPVAIPVPIAATTYSTYQTPIGVAKVISRSPEMYRFKYRAY